MAKVRVYELAKELGVDSKALLKTINDMGEFVRSASSTIEAPVERRIKEKFAASTAAPAPSPAPEAKPAARPAPKPAAQPAATVAAKGMPTTRTASITRRGRANQPRLCENVQRAGANLTNGAQLILRRNKAS